MMTDIKKTLLFTVQTAIWGFAFGVFVSLLPAQEFASYTGAYPSASSADVNEMTVGEILAAPGSAVPAEHRGQSIPVTMTRMAQTGNSGVSNANYEVAPQAQVTGTYSVQQTGINVLTETKEEPRQLPDDFPTGEMAPLNPQNLISFSEVVTLSEGPFQQITIIDPIQKVICVYHINMGNGQIELKSARKIEWDLQLIFLNSKKPLPQDVQAILQQTQKRR